MKIKIRRFKKFWQVVDANALTAYQHTDREIAASWAAINKNNLFGAGNEMDQRVYRNKAYRDKRYFVTN